MKSFIVIHHETMELSRQQANIAIEAGADGVLFISHSHDEESVLALTVEFQSKHLNIDVGANFLSLKPHTAIEVAIANDIKNLWIDFCGVNSMRRWDGTLQKTIEAKKHYNGRVFCGVAFKYQEHEPNPIKAVEMALSYGFIPTTSGEKTGACADIEAIKVMGQASKNSLALASGLNPENLHKYKPHIEFAFVSTGVSVDGNFYELDIDKLNKFIAISKS